MHGEVPVLVVLHAHGRGVARVVLLEQRHRLVPPEGGERERETERERDRERETERETERDKRETERETEKERDREREAEKQLLR